MTLHPVKPQSRQTIIHAPKLTNRIANNTCEYTCTLGWRAKRRLEDNWTTWDVEFREEDMSDKENSKPWWPWETSSNTPPSCQPPILTLPLTPPTPLRPVPFQPRQLGASSSSFRRFAKVLSLEQARLQTQPYIPKHTQQMQFLGPGSI